MPNAVPAARGPVRLIPNWRAVLKWAWSVRLMALAALLSGIEVLIQVLTAYAYQPPIPTDLFAILSGLVTVCGASNMDHPQYRQGSPRGYGCSG